MNWIKGVLRGAILPHLALVGYAVVALGLMGYCTANNYKQREIGAANVLIDQLRKSEAAATKSAGFYQHRSDSLVKAGRIKDSLLTAAHNKASVAVFHVKEKEKFFQDSSRKDSVSADDVDEYMTFVDEALGAKDSEIAAARNVITNRDSVITAKDSVDAAKDRRIAALQEQNKILSSHVSTSSSRISSWVKVGEILGAGYVGYRVGKR